MSSDKKQQQPVLDVLHLDFDQEVPNDLIGENKKEQLIEYNGDLYVLKNNPTHTILTKSNRKYKSEKPKIQAKYTPNYTYLLDNRLNQYKIPKEMFRYIMKFFREIYREYKAECGVVLFLNPDTKEWRTFFPVQTGNGGHLDYLLPVRKPKNKKQKDELNIQDSDLKLYEKVWNDKEWNAIMNKSADEYEALFDQGFLNYGTIHSHCEMDAFHSGVDDKDEFERPGVHITIGKVNSEFDYSARLIAAKVDWKLDILDLVDVASVDELKKDIDSIVVSKEHYERFIDRLDGWGGNLYQFSHGNGFGGYASQFNYGNNNHNDKPNDYYDSYSDYWRDKNKEYGKAQNLLDKKSKSYENDDGDKIDLDEDPEINFEEGELIMERSSYRIQDKKTGLVYWISMQLYTENKPYFEQDRFKILPDPRID